MAIPAMALLQQHDARWHIVVEPAARRSAAIEAREHSELGAFGTGGVWNWGRNRAVKTHRLVQTLARKVFPLAEMTAKGHSPKCHCMVFRSRLKYVLYLVLFSQP